MSQSTLSTAFATLSVHAPPQSILDDAHAPIKEQLDESIDGLADDDGSSFNFVCYSLDTPPVQDHDMEKRLAHTEKREKLISKIEHDELIDWNSVCYSCKTYYHYLMSRKRFPNSVLPSPLPPCGSCRLNRKTK